MSKALKDNGFPISISFVSQRSEMVCRFMELKRHPFYFKSLFDDIHVCYRLVELHAYLVSYKMFSYETEEYFLVFGCNIDKVFEESYADRQPYVFNQSFSQRICTELDLIYLQKALRGDSTDSLFYPLHDASAENYRTWIKECLKVVTGSTLSEQTLMRSIPEYAAIDVRTVFGNTDNCTSVKALDNEFNEKFFKKNDMDFKSHWTSNDDALLALCLLRGNENKCNVSNHQVEKYASHAFTNNKFEMTYVGQGGIVFMRTHHPFLETDKNLTSKKQETMVAGLDGVQNVYELCTVLSLKKRLEQLKCRLEESPDANVRSVMAKLAQILNAKLTNVVDFGNKYRFIYEQMHVLRDFENLKQSGELLSDAYQLRLSQRINWIVLFFTALSLCAAIVQIFQSEINSQNDSMNTQFIPLLSLTKYGRVCFLYCNGDVCCNSALHTGDSNVILCVYIIVALLVLLLFVRYVLCPYIKDLHKRLHREIDDNL